MAKKNSPQIEYLLELHRKCLHPVKKRPYRWTELGKKSGLSNVHIQRVLDGGYNLTENAFYKIACNGFGIGKKDAESKWKRWEWGKKENDLAERFGSKYYLLAARSRFSGYPRFTYSKNNLSIFLNSPELLPGSFYKIELSEEPKNLLDSIKSVQFFHSMDWTEMDLNAFLKRLSLSREEFSAYLEEAILEESMMPHMDPLHYPVWDLLDEPTFELKFSEIDKGLSKIEAKELIKSKIKKRNNENKIIGKYLRVIPGFKNLTF